MSAEQGDEWTPYHEFRKRTDPPPWGQGLDAEEPPMAEQGDVEAIREGIDPNDRVSIAALDRLAAALERAELALEGERSGAAIDFARAEKAERALGEIVKFEGAVEGDESDQADALVEVSRIARAALRPSEDTSDES